MSDRTLDDQLAKYLADAHSIEEQALIQLRLAPRIAGDERLAAVFRQHLEETERQKRLVDERLGAHGGDPSRIKDLVMKAGGAGFALFAATQPDTPGKLTAHAYSYEHLELASYELLGRVAERAGDRETAEVARRIRDEAIQLLSKGADIVKEPELARAFSDHLEETRRQQELVAGRLRALDGSPSRIKDAAMRLGALNWGGFFAAHPDTPGKLAAFAYAFEHLEIAGYEELRRVAQRAADPETVEVADRILLEERAAAERIASLFDRAVEASLEEAGVTVGGVSAPG